MTKRTKQGTYYLGRTILLAKLTKQKLGEALKTPTSIEAGDYHWTITEFKESKTNNENYIFGKLTKYKPKGEVDVIDVKSHTEQKKDVDNTKVASSPFVYLPEYSGIAYLHVWNQIQQDVFIRRFKELIEKKYGNFFVDCRIEAISDLATFYKKISDLSSINYISSKVNPPNPMFGPLWRSLMDYLKKRHVNELKIEEKARPGEEIKSNLKELIKKVELDSLEINYTPDIADAAILMATDGYGQGKVHGVEGNKKVVVCTSDTIKNFKFDTEPDPLKLYETARDIFKEITEKRHMEHEEKNI